MFRLVGITVGLVALSAAGGFALSFGHRSVSDGPGISALSPVPLRVTQATATVPQPVSPVLGTDSLTPAQSPLIVAPASDAASVATNHAADAIAPVATQADGIVASQGSRTLTPAEMQAPPYSLRPRSRGEDLTPDMQPEDEPQIVARPLPAGVSDSIVMVRPVPHSFDVPSTGSRDAVAYQPRDTRVPPDYAPVPRYLIGVFR